MYYQPYYPPITLQRTFDRDCSPSPDNSVSTARWIFDFDVEHLSQWVSVAEVASSNVITGVTACPSVQSHEGSTHLIPPPRGTLSKPGSGGYSLWDALGWEWGTYRDVQVHSVLWPRLNYIFPKEGLHLVCEQHLDMTSPFHLQKPESIAAFYWAVSLVAVYTKLLLTSLIQAQEKFPKLAYYQDSWVTRDFATMYLKNKVGSNKAKEKMQQTTNI